MGGGGGKWGWGLLVQRDSLLAPFPLTCQTVTDGAKHSTSAVTLKTT